MLPIQTLLLACSQETAPPPATPAPAPAQVPAAVAEEPTPVAEPSEPPVEEQAEPAVPEGVDPRLVELLSPEQLTAMVTLREAQEQAEDSAALAQAWQQTRAWAEEVGPAFQEWWDRSEGADPSWIDTVLPGLEAAIHAEGTALVLQHKQATWSALARETMDTGDDSFFALTAVAWDNAGAQGWPRWGERNWDYGGCSTLGTGTHLEILLRVGHAQQVPEPWGAVVQQARQGVLKDITEGNAEFPYCDPATSEPRPVKQIRLELQAIMARVALTEAEKAAIQQRLDTVFADPE